MTLALCLTTLVHAEEIPLGRLFFTPDQRVALERQRYSRPEEPRPAAAGILSVDGVVRRSSGKSTVWINGVAVEDNEAATVVHVAPSHKNPGRVIIRSGESAPASAKVGDTVRRDSVEETDLLQGGRIDIRRQNPAR